MIEYSPFVPKHTVTEPIHVLGFILIQRFEADTWEEVVEAHRDVAADLNPTHTPYTTGVAISSDNTTRCFKSSFRYTASSQQAVNQIRTYASQLHTSPDTLSPGRIRGQTFYLGWDYVLPGPRVLSWGLVLATDPHAALHEFDGCFVSPSTSTVINIGPFATRDAYAYVETTHTFIRNVARLPFIFVERLISGDVTAWVDLPDQDVPNLGYGWTELYTNRSHLEKLADSVIAAIVTYTADHI